MEGIKIERKIKNRFKFNKLIIYVNLNSFSLFRLRNFKIYKILGFVSNLKITKEIK